MSYESDDDDHRKPTKVEFGNGNIELNTFLNSSRTGRKSQTEDSRMRNSRKSMDMDPLELVKL